MAYRKHFENWLESDVSCWGTNVEFNLIDSDCHNFTWHLNYQDSVYEISYSDCGQIALTALPKKYWPGSYIREIYVGDNSKTSYNAMMSLLSENITDII
jgi:hypothetical protein